MKSFNKFIYWYAVIALTVPNVALCFSEHLSTWAALANIVLPFAAYMALMSICRKPGKMVWWLFLLIFFAAFQIVLLYLFGKGVIAVDMFLNLVTTNPGEAMELLDNLIPGVASVFILYLPLLILGVVSIRSKKATVLCASLRKRYCQWASALAIVGCIFVATAYLSHPSDNTQLDDHHAAQYSVLDDLYPVNAFYNLYLAVKRNNASINYKEASANFRFEAQATHPEDSCEVYVMVIGETARAMNFSLYGYQRDTNPRLSTTTGLVTFSDVTTQSNTTHKSVPMLLSQASATDFERLFHEKGILQAYREAGFHTVFLSNQRPNHSFIDFLGEQADQWLFLKTGDANQAGRELAGATSKDGNYYDADLLPILDKILNQKRKKEFIVLHTYGSHFNYMERYPREMAHFLPDTHCEAKLENRPDLINAYDNTIRYTDFVLSGVIERLRKHGGMSAMLYTSDHGENIFDDAHKLFLHASPRASEYELRVPFLVWTSQSFRQLLPEVSRALSANSHKQAQSSRSAFHTMLNIGGISTRYLQTHMSLASMQYQPAPLLYLNDHNEAIPQAECGF